MQKRIIILILLILAIFIITNLNLQGKFVRTEKAKTEYLTTSSNLPEAQPIPTPPAPAQPPNVQAQPIIRECSTPQLLDPVGIDSEESARIDNRYIVWVEFTNNSISRNISYYDLGHDNIFGTSDDGGKFIVNSPDWDNDKPTIHSNKIMFLSGSYAPVLYSNVQLCTIPSCATLPPTIILSIPSPSGINFYYDADFYNNLVVYSESIGLNPSIVSLYDLNTNINTPILSQGAATDVEIEGDILVSSNHLSPNLFVIYAYHIPTGSLIQVTNPSSGNAITPRLNLIQPNVYFLSFYLLTGPSGDVVTTSIMNGLLQPIYGLDIQNSQLIGTDYDLNQNIYEIFYQDLISGDLFLQKTILASNQKIVYAVPRTFNNMYPNGDVRGNNIVFNVGIPTPTGGINMISKNAISQCI